MKHLLAFFFSLLSFSLFSQYGKQCLSGDCENGTGVLDYGPKIGHYEGEFKNGKREGFGTMHYADGRKWKGEWKKDAFKGGITQNVPYYPADSLKPEGISAVKPFTDALYRIIATAPSNFKDLKGTKTGKELNKYDIWQPKVMLPTATRGYISAKTGECRYYFLEAAPIDAADKMFIALNKKINESNPQNWVFTDLSSHPGLPFHRKFYKWTIATPATLRLEMKQNAQDARTFDVFIILTP